MDFLSKSGAGKLLFATLTIAFFTTSVFAQASTFGGDSQHTGIFDAPAQNLNVIKWQTDIDLVNTGQFAHYGSPVITPANTVFVPVRISQSGIRIDAFNGANGTLKYTLATDFIMPSSSWVPSYNMCIVGNRLYFPGAGGSIFYVENIDSNSPTTPVRQVFYTSVANYLANKSAYDATVFANTPITADSSGNIFFGYRTQGTPPAPLANQSGFVRTTAAGVSTTVLASNATGDASSNLVSHNLAPALSNDETIVYFVFKATSSAFNNYLVGLDSTTLATKHIVFMRDPVSNNGAQVPDLGTSSPMVAPDGDVYFGVLGNPSQGSRGWLLRYSGDLTVTKTPGHFGWDYTPAIVPASMVPSYTGTSSYLIFCKYNNYPTGNGVEPNGDGVNRVAVLDPNASQRRPQPSLSGFREMREVLTAIGFTPDDAPGFPLAVQEFCINAPAVNPATKSVYFDSEDGHIYRWNLEKNSVDQAVALSPGLGQPYVPTVIGPDGTLYTLNGGNFFAVGTKAGVDMSITSSSPDLRKTVVGDSVTFTATVTGGSTVPTGTVTFTDLSYDGLNPAILTLASNVPVDSNGRASITTSALVASSSNFGNHFITATYHGDGGHLSTAATMVQKVHQFGSTIGVQVSNPNPDVGQSVTFNVTVNSVPAASALPTGYVTMFDNNIAVDQQPLNSSSQTSFARTFTAGIHRVRFEYMSDVTVAYSETEIRQNSGPIVAFTNQPFSASEGAGHVNVQVAVVGPFSAPIQVDYATSDTLGATPCSTVNGNASSRCDYLATRGTLTFNPSSATVQTIAIPITDDAFVEGAETFKFTLSNVRGATLDTVNQLDVTINDNDSVAGVNPIDDAGFFVRQHYIDFLNREPDTDGFNFWRNEIISCGSDQQCIEVKRINVSAAFFFSIEYQETGYLVYRIYKSAFGNLSGAPVPVTFQDFLAGTQAIGNGVQVNVGNWQAQLEANKVAFTQAFVQRADFLSAYPNTMTAAEYVDKLNANAGGVLSPSERTNLINVLGATPADVAKRAQVLRAVAEDGDLKTAEFNKAFVLMQYFGYLRRNPNDAPQPNLDFEGYNFWLTKLNNFGNYVDAELVKAFIISGEYRQRFGP